MDSLLVDLLLLEVRELLARRAQNGIRWADVRLTRFAVTLVSPSCSETVNIRAFYPLLAAMSCSNAFCCCGCSVPFSTPAEPVFSAFAGLEVG